MLTRTKETLESSHDVNISFKCDFTVFHLQDKAKKIINLFQKFFF